MVCPVPDCGGVLDLGNPIEHVVICPKCLRSLYVDENGCRLAVDADTINLTAKQIADLKAMRKNARRAL